ncbi:hypothetical protein IFM89_026791 [Coptis chinensis]|uniref:Uncharacterized protein n=1 Tax=Coptis chinensis TaxID=261450 RepID=A0A835LEN4_9MAGN|nr:hypothetical protein IFM89_026791 [Coptis chinensis]
MCGLTPTFWISASLPEMWGLFCNSCTQQRMYLRGQGDSQVRICDPCKKNFEEAARFEMRHGHKNKTSRGGSKATTKLEDEVLDQILGTDLKKPSLSGREATISNVFSDFERNTSNASSSNLHEGAFPHDGKVDSFRSSSIDTNNDTPEEIGSSSPEELRQLSLEEKKKYKILKGEGKPEEALRAFKRGKELERQANALEIQLRKSKRKALSSSSVAGKTNDDSEGLSTKRKLSSRMDKEEKNDLSSELRDLGWSDADLHVADKEPTKMSLEGELMTLLGGAQKTAGGVKGTGSIGKTQVIELKKKALLFKREGKLAEAKEELKKAKVIEKQLEEQEFLAEADDSDDELSSLIRSLDDGKKDDLSLLDLQNTGIDFNHLAAVPDDFALDGNFDVTEEDMEDPEIGAALESLGWTEDSGHPVVPSEQSVPGDRKKRCRMKS